MMSIRYLYLTTCISDSYYTFSLYPLMAYEDHMLLTTGNVTAYVYQLILYVFDTSYINLGYPLRS